MTGGAVEREAAYYQTIEEFFVERRGPPLAISNADWTVVRRWRKAGLPLRVVLRGIRDALDAHAHSFARHEPVGSLRYCETEVELARERWRAALAGSGPAEDELGRVLERRAEACMSSLERLPPPVAAQVETLARELRSRASEPGSRLEVETWLARRESALVKRLRDAATPELVARLEAEIAADLAPYRQRLPAKVLEQVRAESFARRLLEEHGLPRLSSLDV